MPKTLSASIIFGFGFAFAALPTGAQEFKPQSEFERTANLQELERVAAELSRSAEAARRALDQARARGGEAGTRAPGALQPRIVNGVLTAGFPTTGALLRGGDAGTARSWCTGTLIGCQTFVTAAHCVADNPTPTNYSVFLTHGGVFRVAQITTHPSYNSGRATADLAVVRLGVPVNGITPSAINRTSAVVDGTTGTIAGFGRSGGLAQDYGLKRVGLVRTARCSSAFSNGFVCWNFNAPIGVPGEHSNTCNADSGGPLFVSQGGAAVLAGATSGGTRSSCLAGDHSYDADVFTYSPWIEQVAAGDLGAQSCGNLPQVGGAGTTVQAWVDDLGGGTGERVRQFSVPPGTRLLRVAMNGSDDGTTNFDLLLRAGSGQPSETENDCTQTGSGQYAFCEIASPREGEWSALVRRVSGSGTFQVTVTTFQ